MEAEKIKAIALAVACLFMAGLNLWNEFKDWFDKKYQRKDKDISQSKIPAKEEEKAPVSDIIGKSKFRMTTPSADTSKEDENEPFHSEQLEKEPPIKELINTEDESIPLNIMPNQDTVQDQGVTVDEFQMLANTLHGKPVSNRNESQIKDTLQKMQGTSLLEQFTSQVKGAESIAGRILGEFEKEDEESDNTNGGFDFSKYVRK